MSRAAARRSASNDRGNAARYLLHVVPGLEGVAAEEVRSVLPLAERVSTWKQFDERTSVLDYRYGGSPRDFLSLGTVEDVFVLAARARALRTDAAGLTELGAAIVHSRMLDRALSVFGALHGSPRTFRVVARKAGTHAFRRVDAQHVAERAIRSRMPSTRLVADDADVEFWLSVVEREALLGVRLSGVEMRQHGSGLQTLPASLKPTVARAMVRLSQPLATDVVLDPFCGAGTLLVERANAAPAGKILGGDTDAAAVALARQNARGARMPLDIEQWDATALPLADGSVDVILSNPPFGKKISIEGDAGSFYARVLAEMERVLAADGRVVLVTAQARAVERVWRGARMRICRRIRVLLRGEAATIVVAARAGRRIAPE